MMESRLKGTLLRKNRSETPSSLAVTETTKSGSRLKGTLLSTSEKTRSAVDAALETERIHPDVASEIIHEEERSEDAPPLAQRIELSDGSIANICFAADGLGGAGTSKHLLGTKEVSGAHIASRTARAAVIEFLDEPSALLKSTNEIKDELERIISTHFSKLKTSHPRLHPTRIRSHLKKDFPTTFTLVISLRNEKGTRILNFQVGDSVACIITADCIYSNSDNDTGDAPMENIIYINDSGEPVVHLEVSELNLAPDEDFIMTAYSDGLDKRMKPQQLVNALEPTRDEASKDLADISKQWREIDGEIDDTTLAIAHSGKLDLSKKPEKIVEI